MAVVTSAFSLDKQNPTVREMLAEKAELVGAVRLPNKAFKTQGTEVLTDIVFLRKREQEKEFTEGEYPSWTEVVKVGINENGELQEGVGENQVYMNRYLYENRGAILGDKLSIESGMYGRPSLQVKQQNQEIGSSIVESLTGQQQNQEIGRSIVESIASQRSPDQKSYSTRLAGTPSPLLQPADVDQVAFLKEGALYRSGIKIMQVVEGKGEAYLYGGKEVTIKGKIGKRLSDYIYLRDAVKEVIQSQREQRPVLEKDTARRKLHTAYDLFVRNHGPINRVSISSRTDAVTGKEITTKRYVNLNQAKIDPDVYLVQSIELYDEEQNKGSKGSSPRTLSHQRNR